MDKLAILIINHETPVETQRLIDHINKFFHDKYDLTIVDNSKWFKLDTAHIKNSKNMGFDQVVLKWLKDVRGKYVGYWVLNSDCILNPVDYIQTIVEYLSTDPNIGLLSTLVHEKKGWGDTSDLQNPQNIKHDSPHNIGYIDFQSAIISNSLLSKFRFDVDLVYFLGGLDLDFNILCERYSMSKILIPELELTHLGCQSYREPDGSLIEMRVDEVVETELRTFIDSRHLQDKVSGGGELISYGILKRYGMEAFSERDRMINITPTPYNKLKGAL